MSCFNVQFETPLFSAIAVDAVVLAEPTVPMEENSQQGRGENAWLSEMARSIENQLRQIEQTLHVQDQLIAKAAGEYAIEITRTILQQDDELVQKRISRYFELAMSESNHPADVCVYAHSRHTAAIESWLTQKHNVRIEVAADDALADGDCRLEFSETGLLASLEHQMELIKARLQQSIAKGEVSL